MGVMSGEITYFREIIGFGYILGKGKKQVCIHTSSLSKGDDPQCFSFHPWRIKPIFVKLTLMQ
jgi:hypothetical protein